MFMKTQSVTKRHGDEYEFLLINAKMYTMMNAERAAVFANDDVLRAVEEKIERTNMHSVMHSLLG